MSTSISPLASDNRRRSTRIPVSLAARATVGKRKRAYAGESMLVLDLSLDGARVSGLAQAQGGEEVDLAIDLGRHGTLHAKGNVVREDDSEGFSTAGVKFSSMPTKDLVKLAEYLWG